VHVVILMVTSPSGSNMSVPPLFSANVGFLLTTLLAELGKNLKDPEELGLIELSPSLARNEIQNGTFLLKYVSICCSWHQLLYID